MVQIPAMLDVAHVIQQAVAPVFLQESFIATASVRIDPPQDRAAVPVSEGR